MIKKEINAKMTIELEFENELLAKSICIATSPENSETPKGTIANSIIQGKKVLFIVETEEKFRDLMTTIEDFLEKVEISRKTIDIIKK